MQAISYPSRWHREKRGWWRWRGRKVTTNAQPPIRTLGLGVTGYQKHGVLGRRFLLLGHDSRKVAKRKVFPNGVVVLAEGTMRISDEG
jgi:hypothetical protein